MRGPKALWNPGARSDDNGEPLFGSSVLGLRAECWSALWARLRNGGAAANLWSASIYRSGKSYALKLCA